MTRTELRYTYCVTRKLASGKFKTYWRFRRGGRDLPLPASPGDAAFHAAYSKLMEAQDRVEAAAVKPSRHTFEWLAREYLASVEFAHLAERTRKDYRQVLDNHLLPALGPERYDCINRATVKVIRDAVGRDKPRTGEKVRQVTSVIYSWADQNDLVPESFNPAANLKKLRYHSEAITIWSPEEIDLFLSRTEGVAQTYVMLALYTGQRRGDLAAMTWRQFQGDIIRVRQNKTGEMLDIPCHPRLKAHLESIRTNFGGPILRGDQGRPMSENALSSLLKRAVDAIDDMPSRTIHGLRYAAAGALEEARCSVEEIMSIVGHRTYQMARKYFSQRKRSEAAMRKLASSE